MTGPRTGLGVAESAADGGLSCAARSMRSRISNRSLSASAVKTIEKMGQGISVRSRPTWSRLPGSAHLHGMLKIW